MNIKWNWNETKRESGEREEKSTKQKLLDNFDRQWRIFLKSSWLFASHQKLLISIILTDNLFEEQATSWSLAHQHHLVPSLIFWTWWGSIKRGPRCSLQWNEKIRKRKEKQSLVCLSWKHLVFLRASSIIANSVSELLYLHIPSVRRPSQLWHEHLCQYI